MLAQVVRPLAILAAALVSTVLLAAPSTAARASVDEGDCWRAGTANLFANANEPISLDTVYTFPEYRCNVDRIRIYKAYADNRAEVRQLLVFSQSNDKAVYKMAFCRTSETEAHIVDFAYWYYQWMEIRAAEREGYADYLSAYAAKYNCRIY